MLSCRTRTKVKTLSPHKIKVSERWFWHFRHFLLVALVLFDSCYWTWWNSWNLKHTSLLFTASDIWYLLFFEFPHCSTVTGQIKEWLQSALMTESTDEAVINRLPLIMDQTGRMIQWVSGLQINGLTQPASVCSFCVCAQPPRPTDSWKFTPAESSECRFCPSQLHHALIATRDLLWASLFNLDLRVRPGGNSRSSECNL